MNWQISRALHEGLLAAAAGAHPHEACGLLLGDAGVIREAVPAPNVAADPARSFEIDPATLLRVHREARGRGLAVIGHYHSHPNGSREPSRRDAARALENGQLWLIVAGGAVAAWAVAPGGPVHGRFAWRALEVA
jgi:proteasome lid subunit RPN8/RPN11